MSVAEPVNRPAEPADRSAAAPARHWLVSPTFDLLFLINGLWPLLFFLGCRANLTGHSALQFWQVYFVTTPHRWITLGLVFGDSARFRERPWLFLALVAVVVVGCLGVQFSTGTLTCLLAIDYIWNAWHFAAQHHGIYRIYARRANPQIEGGNLRKWTLRLTLLYVIFRVAGWSWQFTALEVWLGRMDYLLAALLGLLLLAEWLGPQPRSWGRSGYLTSVVLMYLALLAAVHWQRPDLALALSTASALFHAVEYLAIVSWSVQDRGRKGQSAGLLRQMASSWTFYLAAYALALGVVAWKLEENWLRFWLTLNVIVAFLHYSYDGLIWKRPAPGGR